MKLTKFTFYYLLFTIVLAVIAMLMPYMFPGHALISSTFWLIFFFLGGITYIAYLLVYTGLKRGGESSIMVIMASITLKMILSMAFVLIYSLKHKENTFLFVCNFFSLYLLFTLFEIYAVLRILRHQNKK